MPTAFRGWRRPGWRRLAPFRWFGIDCRVDSTKLRPCPRLSAGQEQQRSRFAPELPTIAETVPGFSVESWWGAFAPPATPRALVNRLNAEIRAIVASPEMREVFDKEGVDSASMTAAEFAAFVHADIKKWRGVARKLDIVGE